MTGFLALVNHLFDILVWPFRSLHPFYSLTVFSLLTTVFTLIVFRYASDQPAMRRVKDRLQAHVLEVRLFPDQLPVVLWAYSRLLAGVRSEEHTSELQSRLHLVCRLLLEKKKYQN